jgi:hypothetical protein
MTITEIVAISKHILELGAAPFAAVAIAKQEVASATGYKATIARSKLREAEAAVAEHEATVTALKAQLPTDEASEMQLWFGQQYAEYEVKREAHRTTIGALEDQLAAELQEAKKGAWKWAKATPSQIKEGVAVMTLRAQIAATKKVIEELDEAHTSIKKGIAEYRVADEQDAEFQIWLDGGAKPEYLRRRDEAERAEFLRDCTVLKLPKRGEPYTFKFAAAEDSAAASEEWIAMTMEDYIKTLMLSFEAKPAAKEEDEVVVFKPYTRSGKGASITPFMAARAARKAARQATPTLVVTEVS